MNGAAWLLALATLGLDYGWKVDERGHVEYIIQISPDQHQSLLQSPDGISSNLPPEVVRHVRRFRIVVGNAPLPKDPLPEFSEGQALGGVTPINVDASKVNPSGVDFAGGANDLASGFETPALESTVTPLETQPARTVLPGPAEELPGNPSDVVDSILPLAPLPRADERWPNFNTPVPDVGSLASTTPNAMVRRGQGSEEFRPNVSPPGPHDTRPASATIDRSFESPSASLPRRNVNTPIGFDDRFEGKEKPWGALAATVCALCLSIGGNVYLGWIAWGYYLRYRESFESWRGSLG